MATMSGVVLPGDSTVKHVEVDVPEPEHGQMLLQMKASSICGSDIPPSTGSIWVVDRRRTGG